MVENLLQQFKTILNDVWDRANHRLMGTSWAGSGINSYMFETDTTILNDVWDPVNHRLNINGGSTTPSPLTTKGDIFGFSTTEARLPAGTNGQVLSADSAEPLGLKWITGVGGSSPLTTKGDLYTYSTLDARLAVGSNGQILSSDSTQATGLKWIAASSGTVTASGPPVAGQAAQWTSATDITGVAVTGSGSYVKATSPTLVTPILGTPTSGVATNLTGTAAGLTAGNVTTNANLTGHVTSVGNAAVLGSFTSAQLATALTDETGTGVAVFADSPTFTTKALFPDGATATPGIAFAAEASTGFYRTGTRSITLAAVSQSFMTFDVNNARAVLQGAAQLGWTSTGTASTSAPDAMLTRFAAGNVQLGAAGSASPVAQILSAQDGAGTDIAGPTWTLRASRGTGAGAVGKIVLAASAAPLGTGTTLQTAVTHLTIGGGIGFFATAPVAQQTFGATVVNNVAATGTAKQFDDFTNGTVYATDYAALHATVSQLCAAQKLIVDALRAYGLLT